MQRFKNILLVAGGASWEKNALKRAIDLAKNNHARLTVVDVIEELPRDMRRLVTSFHIADIQNLVVEERLEDLKQHIEVMTPGPEVTAKVLIGTPFLEIIREVLKNKYDLVMKVARGGNRLKEMLFGSTAMHLMRKCPCPVWVIKSTHQKKYTRIMAAVAPDSIDEKKENINVKIMELATSLARVEKSELHVVQAWDLLLPGPGFGRISQSEVDKLKQNIRAEHKDRFAQLVKRYAANIPKDRLHLLKGNAEDLIPAMAKSKGIELLVMGTVSRTGIAGFIMGNTAERVLQQVDCSVLTVKPDGFITPVKISRRNVRL